MATLKTNTITHATGSSVGITASSIVLTGAVTGVTTLAAGTVNATNVNATTFTGALSGNASTATTVSGGTQANITTCANLTVTGALSPLNVTRADASTAGGGAALSCTASAVCGVITITTASAATSAITVTNTTITSADSIVFLQAGAGVPATTLLTISSVFAGGATQFVIGISTTAVPANAKISFLVVS